MCIRDRYKIMAFSVSAALAGVAGVLYAHNLSSLVASPKNFGYNMSIMVLVFVVLGGIGTVSYTHLFRADQALKTAGGGGGAGAYLPGSERVK